MACHGCSSRSPPPPAPPASGRNAESGWFGFRPVDPDQRTALVRGVFGSVAGRYDLMNDLMSAGVHRLWKAHLVDMARPRPGIRLLDVAGGTGDIAFRFLERAGPGAEAVICDLSEQMVATGRDRAADRGLVSGLCHVVGNAEALPLPSRSVELFTIAFGLRNVTRIDAALAEAHRVLKPGGRFLCLEFSHVALPSLRRLYDAYSFGVIPLLGQIVARDRASYRYLVESIRKFPTQTDLAARMADAGFAQPTWRNLSGGIVAIHSGWRV